MPTNSTHRELPVTVQVAHCQREIELDPQIRAHTAYIVVDVIRATTTLAVMFERGVRRVFVARDVESARHTRATLPTAVLAGEVRALRPDGFDQGNSPAEWGALDVTGRSILFSTSNGARALHAAIGGGPVFAGSLRNASAVTAVALAAARALATPEQGGMVTVVCSGLNGEPATDDSLCAGWLTQTLLARAAQEGVATVLMPGAQHALTLLEAQGNARNAQERKPRAWLAEALAQTDAARQVLAAGLDSDIAWCADVDASRVVPMVAGEDVARALVIVEQAPADVIHAIRSEELP